MIYALIKNDKVDNLIVIDDVANLSVINPSLYDEAIRVDELEVHPHIGWDYVDGVFSDPNAPVEE